MRSLHFSLIHLWNKWFSEVQVLTFMVGDDDALDTWALLNSLQALLGFS